MVTAHESLGVILLGAGASVRMGRPKLLLPWQGTTVIGHLLAQWQALGAGQVAVVLRPGDAGLAAELDRLNFPATQRIKNPEPERGMFSSIVEAANWPGWRPEILRYAVVLGDQPHLEMATLHAVLAVSAQNPHAICQPTLGGREKHPVILPQTAVEELKSSQLATLKDYLKLTALPRVQCPVPDAGLALDLDTPEDYHRLTISR